MSQAKYIFKIVVVGDGAVGKTSLIKRYTEESFQSDYIMTIGANFAVKNVEVDGILIKLQIWDLAGQPHFKEVRSSFYKGAVGVMYVFDVCRPESCVNLLNWKEELVKVCGEVPGVLLANKIDLEEHRKVTVDMGKELAARLGEIPYFETSALTGAGVREAFQKIAELAYEAVTKKK
ncbi:MAG: Rab family GTPase [Candidatus Jordarchaeales archaeon]